MRDRIISIVICMSTMVLVACPTDSLAAAQPPTGAGVASSGDSPGGEVPAGGTLPTITGKVVETMNAGVYTYVKVDDGSKQIWAAAPQFAVAVGDEVVVPEGTPMQNFRSQTLGRTFDVVYFVTGIQVAGGQSLNEQIAAVHGTVSTKAAAVALDLSNIEKADGGRTVAELFANKTALVGKEVVVRGKVAKFTPGVMGKNWIHVQDGTGGAGTDDVTVTTNASAAVGDTVLVHGTLSTDRNFGFGYKYEVIIENATVAVE